MDSGKLGRNCLNRTEIRHQLADAAKTYNWQKVLELLNAHPDLVNSTRPGGESLYTPLHQAARGNAPPEVIQKMLDLGASLTVTNIEDERPVDIAKRKGYQHLVQPLNPDQEKSGTEAQSICALRFQGYEYVHSINTAASKATGGYLAELIKPVVEELTLHSSNNDNFAALFGLQRFLHKWGGEYLTKYSKEHIAYDFLFLHLYSCEPPEPFRHNEYCLQWQENFLPKVENIAATVRKSFRRIGSGKEIAL